MHITVKRLYEVAARSGLTSEADIAKAMGVTYNVVNNWSRRGMSKAGCLQAQVAFGCNANWIETGEGMPDLNDKQLSILSSFNSLDPSLQRIAMAQIEALVKASKV